MSERAEDGEWERENGRGKTGEGERERERQNARLGDEEREQIGNRERHLFFE